MNWEISITYPSSTSFVSPKFAMLATIAHAHAHKQTHTHTHRRAGLNLSHLRVRCDSCAWRLCKRGRRWVWAVQSARALSSSHLHADNKHTAAVTHTHTLIHTHTHTPHIHPPFSSPIHIQSIHIRLVICGCLFFTSPPYWERKDACTWINPSECRNVSITTRRWNKQCRQSKRGGA